MPIIYLSPSTQENNFYVSGGSEEYWMNRLAAAMVPYLNASGIPYVRNTPEMTAASSILASNSGNFDLHLALHSNGAPEGQYGQIRGVLYFIIQEVRKDAVQQKLWLKISKKSIPFPPRSVQSRPLP